MPRNYDRAFDRLQLYRWEAILQYAEDLRVASACKLKEP